MSAPAPRTVLRVEPPRNCYTCGWASGDGGRTCDALTMDEDEDAPIIEYTHAHCDLGGDGMPVDSAPCPRWRPR